jgi:hypothetical protein
MDEPAYYVLLLAWVHFSDKIWMFNVFVPDSYITVCHLTMKDLGFTSPKVIFDFTILKGDYHLTASWCCISNSKSPTFMGPNVLRANDCNGSLVSEPTKSSNLTGKTLIAYLLLAITNVSQQNIQQD